MAKRKRGAARSAVNNWTRQAAAQLGAIVALGLTYGGALLWMAPAIRGNVNWEAGLGTVPNFAAVGFILGSALFVGAGRRSRSISAALPLFALAFAFIAYNATVAFSNASHRTYDARDNRAAKIEAAEHAKQARSRLSQQRVAAVLVASEEPAAAIEARLNQAIASQANRYRATGQCSAANITLAESETFCAQIAAMRAKLEAARKRDTLDAQMTALDLRRGGETPPTSADPFADSLAALAGSFGLMIAEETRPAITAGKDFAFALLLEILAAFGPACWLARFERSADGATKPKATKPAQKTAPLAIVAANEPAPAPTPDPFERFTAEAIEGEPGAKWRAGDAWASWQAWCAAQGVDPGNKQRFGRRMKARFNYDRNNNRPMYLGIRAKRQAPSLKLVSNA